MLSPDDAAKVVILDVPTLEGAMLAAVEAGCGAPLEQVVEAANEARNLQKVDH
jgi:dihydroxyacetone kinase DhaKLM complex PTS-EIIA-like component DhaM